MLKKTYIENIDNTLEKEKVSFFKAAFTLTEVVIATFISAIILSFIFVFLTDIIDGIWSTRKEVITISSFYEFTSKINNLSNIYNTGSIIIETSTWSDVYLMKDTKWLKWVLVWPVNLQDFKLDNDNTVYENKWLWFRKLNEAELIAVELDPQIVFDYSFHKDQIFSNLKVQDFIAISYNAWTITNIHLILDLNFQTSLIWQLWSELPKDSLIRLNIDL